MADDLVDQVPAVLDQVQAELLAAAEARLAASIRRIDSYAELQASLEQGGGFLVPWCDDAENEAAIKEATKATIRCYPLAGQEEAAGKLCFYSGRPATHMAVFARAY